MAIGRLCPPTPRPPLPLSSRDWCTSLTPSPPCCPHVVHALPVAAISPFQTSLFSYLHWALTCCFSSGFCAPFLHLRYLTRTMLSEHCNSPATQLLGGKPRGRGWAQHRWRGQPQTQGLGSQRGHIVSGDSHSCWRFSVLVPEVEKIMCCDEHFSRCKAENWPAADTQYLKGNSKAFDVCKNKDFSKSTLVPAAREDRKMLQINKRWSFCLNYMGTSLTQRDVLRHRCTCDVV